MAPKKRFYRFVKCTFLALTVAFATGSAFAACSSDQIDVTGNGSNCQTAKFTLTTTSTTTSFDFSMLVAGTFYVDCGTGGTLSATSAYAGVSGKTITKSTTSGYVYTCSWNSAGAHTIKFGGAATGYSTGEWGHSIRFNTDGNNSSNENVKKIASISGSLGAIFGTIDGTPVPSTAATQPQFHYAFAYATNLTGQIPEELFNGIHGTPSGRMFQGLFYGCTGLTGTLPANLFSGISGAPADYMFSHTFNGCTGLTGTIPTAWFAGLSGAPANNMFTNMFYNCSGLGSIGQGSITTNYIPRTFLSGITSGTATNPIQNMFSGTGLASTCPNGTNTYTPAQFTNNTGKAWCAGGPHTITYKAGQGGKAANGGAAVDVSQEGLWYGEAFTTLPADTFSKPHAIFTGWEASASPGYPNANTEYQYNNTANITMTALWQCEPDYVLNTSTGACDWTHTYTITYDCGDGATGYVYPQGVESGAFFYPREATGCSKPGYTFNNWYINDGQGTVFYPQSNNPDGYTWPYMESKTFIASWTPSCNAITLNANGGTAGSTTKLYKKTGSATWYSNSSCTTTWSSSINVPTRSGYTFRGFYINSTDAADISATQTNGAARYINNSGSATNTGNNWTTSEPVTLYAGWAQNCVQPTNGTCSLNVSQQNTTYTTSCNTGYTIIDNGTATPSCGYTITYSPGDGGVGNNVYQTVAPGGSFTTMSANTFYKPHATFSAWESVETSSSWTDPDTTYTYDLGQSVTLRAVWTCDANYTLNTTTKDCEETTYTITLNDSANGGSSGLGTIKEVYGKRWTNNNGSTITSVSIPTKLQSTFKGYYENSTPSSSTQPKIPASGALPSNTTFSSSTTLYAVFEACNCETVTGISNCVAQDVLDSNRCIYDITYAAGKYGASQQSGTAGVGAYTPTVSSCTNKPASHSEYTGPSATNANACPWRCETGYSVDASQTNQNSVYTINASANDIKCNNITDYTVSYTMNGGSCSSTPAATYTFGTGLTLCTPTRTGYTFAGWTGSNGSTAQTSVTISTTDTGNKSYTANWTANTYSVTYKANSKNATGATLNSTHTYGTAKALNANGYVLSGYVFKGWSTSSTATEPTYQNRQSVTNLTSTNGGTVTLYAVWEQSKFEVETSSTNLFKFKLSAAGTFYVDCGPAGTLSGTGVSGNKITRTSDVTVAEYKCEWSSSSTKTVKFTGEATNYNTSTSTPAITFNVSSTPSDTDTNAPKITAISGNLSALFPYKTGNAQSGAQPRFYYSFSYAGLDSIPDTLFANYTTSSSFMFYGIFSGCTGLTTVQPALFNRITTGAQAAFNRAFEYCTGITSIPINMFNVSGGAQNMVTKVFHGCTSLNKITNGSSYTNYIPESFISTVTSGTDVASNMFTDTGLASACPAGTHTSSKSQTNGIFSNAGKPWCAPCAEGTYSNTSGQASCTACAIGYDNTGTGNTSCTANTINIVWDGVTSQEALAENVKQVTYDGDIHTPMGANLVQQSGIDFIGWKFYK